MLEKNKLIERQLAKLQRSTLIDEVFPINLNDQRWGTINGFRLGQTANAEVPEEEINAALG